MEVDQPCNYPGLEQGYMLIHPNIQQICDLLEHVKRPKAAVFLQHMATTG